MLPTHRRVPRIGLTLSEPTANGNRRSSLGRPLFRWLAVCLTCGISLWFAPSLLSSLGFRFRSRPPPRRVFDVVGPPAQSRPPTFVRPHPTPGLPTMWSERADRVRDAYLHAYSGYQRYAASYDELLPVTDGSVNNFNGWHVSMIDSLDTMLLMGLNDEFMAAVPVVANETFYLDDDSYAPFFETVIRYLGGLLSAYAISGENILLARADDLGRMLLPALETSSGLPMYAVNTQNGKTRQGWNQNTVLWAEALSCQMEYKYLAHLTGRTRYYHKVENPMKVMYDANITSGLFPTMWNLHDAAPKNTQFSVGAFADSAHEYLLKQWLLTGQTEPRSRDMYLASASAILKTLLYLSPTRHLLYVTDTNNGVPTRTFEHLSCFLPGLLALGAHTLDLPPREKELHRWAAAGLAYTCWITYADQATGLGPDEMKFDAWPVEGTTGRSPFAGRWIDYVDRWEAEGRPGRVPPGLQEVSIQGAGKRDYRAQKPAYLLRPETVESFYVLWRTTGDVVWRERGWGVFEAIERETRTKSGYASITNVDHVGGTMKDEMPSYFLAETLKYLYLLFTDTELIPLDKWVFNTEGHPLPVFQWSEWEKGAYDIPAS